MSTEYVKKATTVDEQIARLKQRGMTIGDEVKAREQLLDIGYFRLGFYCFPFEKTYPQRTHRTHEYGDGCCLEQAIQLYYFDYDLRTVLLRYISRIEINFRTKMIYYVSNKYKDDPHWYVNPKVIHRKFVYDSIYRRKIAEAHEEPLIKTKLTKGQKNAPAWKVLEFLSFGVIIRLYENLQDGQLKRQIAMQYGMDKSSQFADYMNVVRLLRNRCAHGKVLFDLALPKAIPNGPAGTMGTNKTKLSGAYLVLKYLLGYVSANRATDLEYDLAGILEKAVDPMVRRLILDVSGLETN